MSYEDISESLAELPTGAKRTTAPEPDAPDDVLEAEVADWDQYQAEKDIPVSTDVEDTQLADGEREAAEAVEQEQTLKRGRGQKVPLAALHEERSKRQALEAQLHAQAQQLQQFQAQFQAQQQAQQQAAEQAAIPDFDEDPRGYIEAKEKQIAQEIENLKGSQGQQPQIEHVQAQLEQDRAAVVPAVIQLENEFRATAPDYPAAFDLVQGSVDSQLRALYPQANPAQFDMLRQIAMVGFNKQCLANGINPAAHIYQQAQQMGFKPASRAPRVEPPTSLANAHGTSRAPDERSSVRASDIANMSEKEFDDFFNNMKRGSVQRPAI